MAVQRMAFPGQQKEVDGIVGPKTAPALKKLVAAKDKYLDRPIDRRGSPEPYTISIPTPGGGHEERAPIFPRAQQGHQTFRFPRGGAAAPLQESNNLQSVREKFKKLLK